MKEANEKFLEEAADARTVEEVLEAARTCGLEATEEEARMFLSLQEGREGALSDEVLDEVAGGGLRYKGHLIVTSAYRCESYSPVAKFDRSPVTKFDPYLREPSCGWCRHKKSSSIFNVCEIN